MGRSFSDVEVAGCNHVIRTTRAVGRYARGVDPGVARTADMSTESPAVSGRLRALAWLSIACALALIVIVVVFAFRHLPELTAVVVGLAVTAAGGWWLITERAPRRWIGLAGALAGLGIIIGAVIVAAADSDQPVLARRVGRGPGRRDDRIGAPGHGAENPRAGCPRGPRRGSSPPSGAHLQPVVGWRQGRQVRPGRTGRRARRRDGDARPRARPRAARPRRRRPRRRLPRHGRRRRLPGAGRVDRRRARPPVRLRHARGPGTTSPSTSVSTATTLARVSTPSATPSSGGSTTPRSTVASSSTTCRSASTPPSCRRTATATRRSRRPRPCCPSCSGDSRRALRSPVHRPGRHARSTARSSSRSRTTPMCSAPRSTPRSDAGSTPGARRLRRHRQPPGRTPRRSSPSPPSVGASAARTGTSSPPRRFEVRSRSGTAFAGVDGEALEMATPLVFRIFPRGLRLLVPSENVQAAEGRLARNVGLHELLDVARGRP